MGAALALVYSDPLLKERSEKDIAFIEGKVLPAFSSLLRKLERRNHEKRYDVT